MGKLKKYLSTNKYAKMTGFILINALFLYVLFFVVKDFSTVAGDVAGVIAAIFKAAWPFVIGLIIAYILSPLVNFVDNKILSKVLKSSENQAKPLKRIRLRQILSIFLSLIIVVLALAFLIYSFAALIFGKLPIDGIENTVSSVITGTTSYQDAIEQTLNINVPSVFNDKIADIINSATDWITGSLDVSKITATVSGIAGSIANFVIGLIFAIYLLLDKEFFIRLWNNFIKLTAPDRHEKINGTLNEVHVVLTSFIKGACVDSLIIAILSSLCLKILGLEGAVVIGMFAGIANLIPYFGPVLGMIPAFIMGLITEGFWQGAVAVIILFVIQQIDSNVIYPKVVGGSTGLRPLYVLFAITFCGYFSGIIGMLLAVPIAGVVQIFVLKGIEKRTEFLKSRAKSNTDSPENDGVKVDESPTEGDDATTGDSSAEGSSENDSGEGNAK